MDLKRGDITIVKPLLIGTTSQVRLDMVLDTGASLTMIPPDIAKKLGYDLARPNRMVDLITATKVEKAPTVILEAIELLGQRVAKVEVVCKDLPPKSRAEGLLGVNFLDHFDIELFYKSGRLEFKDP